MLLPGLGVSTTAPLEPTAPRSRPLTSDDTVLVSLASFDKLNPQLLEAWNNILGAHPSAQLHLLPGLSAAELECKAPELEPFLANGEVTLYPQQSRQNCVDLLNEADLYLDTFPFGGYNTLVEALAAGCPVITLEGPLAPARFGAAVCRALGLPDLVISRSAEEYVNTARKLIDDRDLRLQIRSLLNRERVLDVLTQGALAAHFNKAVHRLRGMARERDERQVPQPMLASDS